MMKKLLLCSLVALLQVSFLVDVQAGSRKSVGKRVDCDITVGDRDAEGNNLVIAYCDWQVPVDKLKAAFKNVADLDVVVVLDRDAALVAGSDLLDVVLEATERVDLALVDHDAVAHDAEAEFAQGTTDMVDADWDGYRVTKDPAISNGYVKFKNGVHAYLVGAPGWEFEIGGTEGKLRTLSNGMGYSLRKKDEHGDFRPVEAPPAVIESGTLRGMEDIVRALDTDGDTQGNLELACRSQEMIFGIVESSRQGGARVALPLANRALSIAPDNY